MKSWILVLLVHFIGPIVAVSTSIVEFNTWLVTASFVVIFQSSSIFLNTRIEKEASRTSGDLDELKVRLLSGFLSKGDHWNGIGTIEESGVKLIALPDGVPEKEY